MTTPTLHGLESSHFTRVARMAAHELEVPLELVVVRDLRSLDAGDYAGNPALKVPTLVLEGVPIFGTENIVRRLVGLAGERGRGRLVLFEDVTEPVALNAQELVWHAMGAQVQLILARALGRLPAENAMVAKTCASLEGSLDILEARLEDVLEALPPSRRTSLFELALLALVEHLAFRRTASLERRPRLSAFAAEHALRDSARATPYREDLLRRPGA